MVGCYDFIQKYGIFVDVYYFIKIMRTTVIIKQTTISINNSYCRITLGIIRTPTKKILVKTIDGPQLSINVKSHCETP